MFKIKIASLCGTPPESIIIGKCKFFQGFYNRFLSHSSSFVESGVSFCCSSKKVPQANTASISLQFDAYFVWMLCGCKAKALGIRKWMCMYSKYRPGRFKPRALFATHLVFILFPISWSNDAVELVELHTGIWKQFLASLTDRKD